MPTVTCPCGHTLSVPPEGPDRVVCPRCSARIRVRRGSGSGLESQPDGFIRFYCPCGRRLKVRADRPPESGKCPECGRVVPVPEPTAIRLTVPPSHSEAPTEELSEADLVVLERWTRDHFARAGTIPDQSAIVARQPSVASASAVKASTRPCPKCGALVHLGSFLCLACGAHVPLR